MKVSFFSFSVICLLSRDERVVTELWYLDVND